MCGRKHDESHHKQPTGTLQPNPSLQCHGARLKQKIGNNVAAILVDKLKRA